MYIYIYKQFRFTSWTRTGKSSGGSICSTMTTMRAGKQLQPISSVMASAGGVNGWRISCAGMKI